MLPNAAKCQGYNFYYFLVIIGKPTEGVKLPPPPPRLGLNRDSNMVFSREFFELLKNIYFVEDLRAAGFKAAVRGFDSLNAFSNIRSKSSHQMCSVGESLQLS